MATLERTDAPREEKPAYVDPNLIDVPQMAITSVLATASHPLTVAKVLMQVRVFHQLNLFHVFIDSASKSRVKVGFRGIDFAIVCLSLSLVDQMRVSQRGSLSDTRTKSRRRAESECGSSWRGSDSDKHTKS